MSNVNRPRYESKIRPFIGNGNIKGITGIRRCGKSTIMKLVTSDIPGSNLIYLNMDHRSNWPYKDSALLDKYIHDHLVEDARNVLVIDEVQDIIGWEAEIRSLGFEECCDIYITGSNAHLLSGEYGTLLSGRVNLINAFTLTFSECLTFEREYKSERSVEESLNRFLRVGGFPKLWRYGYDEDACLQEVQDTLDMALKVDVFYRFKVTEPDLLERILDFFCDNIGNPTSVFNIYKALKKNDPSTNKDLVYSYVQYLESACLINKAKVLDLKGMVHLEKGYKYFLADIGIKNVRIGFRPTDISGYMENIVYLELRSRGYSVSIGDIDGKEIDLVGIKSNERVYVQLTEELTTSDVVNREFGNLAAIDDNYPKYVVTLKRGMFDNDMDGIHCTTLLEFLQMEKF
ncbi:MAG: ATP-binding protein [Thermoplasmata archaeon]|nr:ATP-binding protein [Thermoplasmata archaeon]